ncbi:MAG TPA: FAD-dependent oxidoreductase [Kofleriaceae bacterium]|nr:FAD-dependent oxidoreductase [Kofleriaceae bacterium]
MGATDTTLTGPDLAVGVDLADVPQGGSLLGHAGGEAVLLVRTDADEVHAVGASCTHYGGPLAQGLVVGSQVRCPWHHACFDVTTGEALGAPAIDPIPCWRVERAGARIRVGDKVAPRRAAPAAGGPDSVVIVGAGAAGTAAAEMLRRQGYAGPITMVGADPARPVDRPNLSKDFLAGSAPEEWVWLRGDDFYAGHDIRLELGRAAVALDPAARTLRLADGTTLAFGGLLLATGADPVQLPIPGADGPQVFTLRTLADSRAIAARAAGAARAVVIGASFIGLEVAAALRSRGLAVDIVAPEARPLERVLGPELGDRVRALHEQHGEVFHLGRKPAAIEHDAVVLDDGTRLPADLVVVGVGVRPALTLAQQAGLTIDRGVVVDRYLQTSAPGIYAAGDIARWPDERTGEALRIEHWVVAQRQGQTAARNLLGQQRPFRDVPFFWSMHHDLRISYVGHASAWDRIDVRGDRECLAAYRRGDRILAVATIGRDHASLQAERLLEQDDQAGLEALLAAG